MVEWLVLVVLAVLAFTTLKVVREFERLVVLRVGKLVGTRGPGLTYVIPVIETALRVDTSAKVIEVPEQACFARDNTRVLLGYFVGWRVTDPVQFAFTLYIPSRMRGVAAKTLQAVVSDIDRVDSPSSRREIEKDFRRKLTEATAHWGIKIISVEVPRLSLVR